MADLRIDNGLIVTIDQERRIIENGSIAIEGRKIAGVGKVEDIKSKYPANRIIDARGKVVLPGFINAHAHTTAEFATRGFVPDDVRIFDWLEWMIPLHEVMTAEEEYLASKLAFVECVKTGTTCFMGAGTDKDVSSVIRAMADVEIRGCVSEALMDVPIEPAIWYKSTEEAVKSVEACYSKYQGSLDGRVNISAIPLQPLFATKELLIRLKTFADDKGTSLCMHSNYDQAEVDLCLNQTGKRPIEYLESIGILGPNVVLVHMVYLSDSEYEILKKHHVKIVHCPTTALKLGYGVTKYGRFPEMLRDGLTVSLGCDGVNGGSSFDMLRAMYLAAGLFKDCRVDAAMISAESALEMGTINGAKALQLEDKIGSIEVGKFADLILLDRKRPEWSPLFNVINTLIYYATGDSVDTVLINGEIVMENRRMRKVDEEELYAEVQQMGESMIRRSGLKLKTRWKMV